MYYCVHRLQPAIFDDYYQFVTNVSSHLLRSVNDDKLYLTLLKKKSGQNSVKYKGVKILNSLPNKHWNSFFCKIQTELPSIAEKQHRISNACKTLHNL